MISLNDLMTPWNGVVERLLDSPFHFVASGSLVVVRWSGRKSGKRFSIPVGYQFDGDALVVVLSKRDEKNWWRNFRSPWPADLLLRRESRSAMGEIVPPGSPGFFAHCEATLMRFPWMGSQLGGIEFDKQAGLDRSQQAILEKNAGVVRFDFVD